MTPQPMPKEPEMYVDTGGADTSGLFPHYEASPDAIETSAEGLDRHGQNIQAFSTEIDAQHQTALASVSGVITEPISTAAQTPTAYSTLLMGSTYVSSGSIRQFGQGVQRFNTTIDNLNEQYRQALASEFGIAEAKYPENATIGEKNEVDGTRDDQILDARVALLRSLVQQYLDARDVLDQDAENSAAQINAGPTDETLQNLYAAGVLPTSVETAFPNVTFTAAALPPDVDEMSDAELADYLQAHPELLNNDQAMAEVAERIEGLTIQDGTASGQTFRDALSGKASPGDVEAEFALLSLVGTYAAYTQSRGLQMPPGASQYLRGLFTDLAYGGAEDRTMDVLEWITTAEHDVEVKVPPEGGNQGGPLETETRTVPVFDQTTQDWMKRAYADGILLMSDATMNGMGEEFLSPDVEHALNDVLRIETSAAPDEAGNSRTEAYLVGGDGFAQLADLLGVSSEGIRPGLTLAEELTESSAETAEVINTAYQNIPSESGINYLGGPEALNRFGPLLEQAVDVAARNVDANEMLLTEAGSNGDSPAGEHLRQLYTFPWPDDGRSVSQYTDWIADYAASDDPAKVEQANLATVGFINFVTDADDDGSTSNFKALMEFQNDGQIRSFGDLNPLLAQSFGKVVAVNLDNLGNPLAGTESDNTEYEPSDGSISIIMEDRSRLFTLVATDETAVQQLGHTIGAYEQVRLDQALQSGDPAVLGTVGAEASRLDGYLAGGMLNASMIEADGAYQSSEQAYEEAMRNVTAGKTIVTAGLGHIPVAGGDMSRFAGYFIDGLIEGEIKPPEPPDGINVSRPASDDFVRSQATYDYLTALTRSPQHSLPPEIQAIWAKYGGDPEFSEVTPADQEKIQEALAGDPLYDSYMTKHLGPGPFNDTAINDEGTYTEEGVRDYLNGHKG